MQAIESGELDNDDEFGIPVLDFDAVMLRRSSWAWGRCTRSLTTRATPTPASSSTARSPSGRWAATTRLATSCWRRLPVQYNIGHISGRRGRHRQPGRPVPGGAEQVGGGSLPARRPALPQNEQLLDIGSDTMSVLYDMPMGIGEPHYAQMIKADKIRPGKSTRSRLGSDYPVAIGIRHQGRRRAHRA
jgi:nitrous-oxide reductase